MRQSLIVLAMVGCLSVHRSGSAAAGDDFTTTDGMKLHYAKLGSSGSPVILIHGSGGSARTWLENGVAQALAKNHVVIVADMRGHSLSQGPRDGDMPLDVIELMDHLKIDRAHIHGFSMGGSILSQADGPCSPPDCDRGVWRLRRSRAGGHGRKGAAGHGRQRSG
jgi:hypothetical protein